jgi:putative heme-binding domain-containing protein
VDNQIRALDHIGLFKDPPERPQKRSKKRSASPAESPKLINPYDEKADLNARARTYLHVNCSICHVSDGGGNSYIELAIGKKLEETKAVGGRPVQGTFGIHDAMIVAPGEPERSVLFYRIASLGGARMPRVGSRVVDEKALDLLSEWIARMPNPKESAATRSEREETDALIKALHDDAPAARAARVEAIRRLTATTSRAIALVRALGSGTFPAPVRAEIIAATKDHSTTEVRDLFERFVPESERIQRLGDHINPQDILNLKGDPGRGRAIFAAESVVNCKSCHRLDGVGVDLGPDLSKIGGKYPRAELLQHILEPSRSVDPKYTVYHLETSAGLVHSGLLIERNEKEIVLRDSQNQKIQIAASDVELLTPQKQSLMPDLLLRSLTAQQATDLLDYLTTLK